jgi:hypothetical protein
MSDDSMTHDDLEKFSEAWNRHDIDAIMAMMTEDCIFETGGGKYSFGTRYQGFEEVRSRFIEVWTELPDIQFKHCRHFIDGDRGCSQWTITATLENGNPLEVDGCDLFDFKNGKIFIKNSYIKNRKLD